MLHRKNINIILAAFLSLFLNFATSAQSSEFNFQGKLTDQNSAATGVYDLSFKLFDGANIQIGTAVTRDDVPVTEGVFTVSLDFGVPAFDGSPRFLEVSVRNGASTGGYTTLTPKQPVSAVPYAVRSLKAATAESATTASQLNGVNASQFVQTSDPRMTDARPPTPGSASYIQNGTSPQASSNFNISGDGVIGGKLGLGLANPQYALHVRGQDVRVESKLDGTFPRFSLNFSDGNPESRKWQNYASNDWLNFTALNDAETQETRWLGVGRWGTSINAVVFPNGNIGVGTNSPVAKLHVVGRDIRLQSSGTDIPHNLIVYSNGGTDNKKWQQYANGGALVFTTLNDAENVEQTWLRVNRVAGTAVDSIELFGGWVRIANLISGGSSSICRDSLNRLATCSSSIRYKKNVEDFLPGLSLVGKLRPVSFNWIADDVADLGLVAEEVAKVEPLLVTRNNKGEVEGVKYDRVGVVLLNAVKEQQAEIESLRKQVGELRKLLLTERRPH